MRRQFGGDLSLAHGADEANALAGGGANQALSVAIVVQRPPGSIDAACKRGVGHDAAVPHAGDQIVLADHAVAVADQKNDEVEDLRFDRDESALATQFAPVRIEHLIFEVKEQPAALAIIASLVPPNQPCSEC